MDRKVALRVRMRAARAELAPGERARQSEVACARLCALPEMRAARTLALYLPFGEELDVRGVARVLRVGRRDAPRIALPVTLTDRRMAFVLVDSAALREADGTRAATLPRCLREPFRVLPEVPGELADLVVFPRDIDAVIVPGLAFDASGRRLGYGGGYYDAFLAQVRAGAGCAPFTVGICFDCQLALAETIPTAPHDALVDAVVTPTQTHRCR